MDIVTTYLCSRKPRKYSIVLQKTCCADNCRHADLYDILERIIALEDVPSWLKNDEKGFLSLHTSGAFAWTQLARQNLLAVLSKTLNSKARQRSGRSNRNFYHYISETYLIRTHSIRDIR